LSERPNDGCAFVAALRATREEIGQRYRFAHTVRVARLADRLAQRHREDPVKARLAGLLHDLARLYSAERLIAECERRGMPIDDFECRHPIVLHARLGAELARERFGVCDGLVLDAIRRHTVAAPEMTRLDAIVYLADGLEPGREFAEREAFERLAFVDLDAAMRAVLRSSLAHLRSRNLEAAPQTLRCLERYESLERTPLSA
jgi:predicted HD superfamily hydrolase involved in NAD metabolism